MTYPEAMGHLLKRARDVAACEGMDDSDILDLTFIMRQPLVDAKWAHAVLPVLIETIEYQYGVIGAIADDKCRARVRHMMRAFGEKGLKAADG